MGHVLIVLGRMPFFSHSKLLQHKQVFQGLAKVPGLRMVLAGYRPDSKYIGFVLVNL